MANFGTEAQYGQLLELLTVERMGSYFESAHGNVGRAFELYEWNMEASAAVMHTTGMVEVLIRNALDTSLASWQGSKAAEMDWLDLRILDERAREDVLKARRRASQRGAEPSHGKVIAELQFGFWRYLVASRYLTQLWIPAGHSAFQYGHPDLRRRRSDVERILRNLNLVRNRAAHHEPIHRRDLRIDFDESVTIAGWVHPVGAQWIAARSQLERLEVSRPNMLS